MLGTLAASARRSVGTVFLCAGAAACATIPAAAGPPVPDRPGYSDGPVVLPAGTVQLEGGYTRDQVGTARYESFGESLIRVGVGRDVELRLFGNSLARLVGGPAARRQVDIGLEDAKVGMKMALRTSPDSGGTRLLPSVALLAAVTLPSGSRAIGSSAVLPEAKVAASWTFPHGTSLYTNVGVARAAASAPSARGWVSAAGWYAPGARLSLFTEFQATQAAYGAVPRSDYVDGGVTYLLNDRLQLDARIGRAAWSAAPAERYFGTGFSTRW